MHRGDTSEEVATTWTPFSVVSTFWGKIAQYGSTKLAQVLMCFEMQRRHPDVGCVPVAPGLVATAIFSGAGLGDRDSATDVWSPMLPMAVSPHWGAQTSLHAWLVELQEHSVGKIPDGVFLQPYYTPPHEDLPWSALGVTLWEVFGQLATWGLHQWRAHPHAYNATFAARLWDESVLAVSDDS